MVLWQGKLSSELAFEKRLKELRPDVKFKYIDARREKTELATNLRQFDLNSVDLVYSFGTTCTQLVKKFLAGRKPHVFNIVSTPVISGIADSIDRPGNNLTGAKLLLDLKSQMEIMLQLKDISSVLFLYDPRETQSGTLLSQAADFVKRNGISFKSVRIIPDASIFNAQMEAAAKEALKYDAVFVLAGSSIHQNARKIFSKIDPSVFVMTASKHFALQGATVAISADFVERGKIAAEYAHKILDGAVAGDIPVSLVMKENVVLFINKDKADKAALKNLDKLDVEVQYIKQLY